MGIFLCTSDRLAAWACSLFAFAAIELNADESNSQSAESAARYVNFLGLDAAPLTEPIITDRPDFTESPAVVPWGHFQLESGYTYSYDDEDGVRGSDQTFPEILLRVGLVKDFELRVGWVGMSLGESWFTEQNDVGRTVDRNEHEDGATDMTVGSKLHLTDANGWVPEFSVITELGLPTGTDTKMSGDVDPQIKWLWSYDLSEKFSLSGNLNFSAPTIEDDRYFQTAASLSLGLSLTDRIGTYFEYFGFYPAAPGMDCAHSLDGGFTYLITENLQIDVRTGFGLNDEADDFFTGIGVSFRI